MITQWFCGKLINLPVDSSSCTLPSSNSSLTGSSNETSRRQPPNVIIMYKYDYIMIDVLTVFSEDGFHSIPY